MLIPLSIEAYYLESVPPSRFRFLRNVAVVRMGISDLLLCFSGSSSDETSTSGFTFNFLSDSHYA